MKYKKRNPVVQALLKFKNKIIEHKKYIKEINKKLNNKC